MFVSLPTLSLFLQQQNTQPSSHFLRIESRGAERIQSRRTKSRPETGVLTVREIDFGVLEDVVVCTRLKGLRAFQFQID